MISQGIDAFCNDTALINATTPTEPQTTAELLTTTQDNLNLWNRLLESSSSALNPAKFTWAHFKWHEKNNLLTLQPATNDNNLQSLNLLPWSPPSTTIETPTTHLVLLSWCACQHDWGLEEGTLSSTNMQPEIPANPCQMLTQSKRNQSYIQTMLLTNGNISPPSIHHPTQQAPWRAETNHDCTPHKIGYPHTYPLAVAYALETHGRAGLWALNKVHKKHSQLIKHMQAKSTSGTVYTILVNHYQLSSGLLQPILKETMSLPWSQVYWIDTLWEFLHQIQEKILLEKPWILHQQQDNN